MEKMIYNIIEKLFAEKNKALEEKMKDINHWDTFKETHYQAYIQGIEKALQIIKEA